MARFVVATISPLPPLPSLLKALCSLIRYSILDVVIVCDYLQLIRLLYCFIQYLRYFVHTSKEPRSVPPPFEFFLLDDSAGVLVEQPELLCSVLDVLRQTLLILLSQSYLELDRMEVPVGIALPRVERDVVELAELDVKIKIEFCSIQPCAHAVKVHWSFVDLA